MRWRFAAACGTNDSDSLCLCHRRQLWNGRRQGGRKILRYRLAEGELQHRLAEARGEYCLPIEFVSSCVFSNNDDLAMRFREILRRNTVCSGEDSVLAGGACQLFQSLLSFLVICRLLGVGMHSQ